MRDGGKFELAFLLLPIELRLVCLGVQTFQQIGYSATSVGAIVWFSSTTLPCLVHLAERRGKGACATSEHGMKSPRLRVKDIYRELLNELREDAS